MAVFVLKGNKICNHFQEWNSIRKELCVFAWQWLVDCGRTALARSRLGLIEISGVGSWWWMWIWMVSCRRCCCCHSCCCWCCCRCCCCCYRYCCTFQVHLLLHTFLFTSTTLLSDLDRGSSTWSLPPPTQPRPRLTPCALLSSPNSDLDGCLEVAAVFQSPFSIILMLRCHFELYLAQKHRLEDFTGGGKTSLELH